MSAPPLLERLGLSEYAMDGARFDERLARTGASVWDRIVTSGRCHSAARSPRLELPPSFRQLLVAVVAFEQAEPWPDSVERAIAFQDHYLEWMPTLRVEQLSLDQAPNGFVFHEPLAWERLPRLRGALASLAAQLEAAEVPYDCVLGAASPADFARRFETFGSIYVETHFGGFMPLLYGYPVDLAAYQRELEREEDPWTVFDRRLPAPLVHELMHFARQRESVFPPYLDECLAGYLGVAVLPELAYPAPGQNNALFASPWFAQVGHALERAFGAAALWQAQSGRQAWRHTYPPALIDAIERLGLARHAADRQPHFLAGNTHPEPWIKLFFLAAAGGVDDDFDIACLDALALRDIPVEEPTVADGPIVEHAVRAMCLHNTQDQGAYRVESAVPDAPIRLDFEGCQCSRPDQPGSLDPAPPRYFLPPALAAAHRANGLSEMTLELHDLAAIEAAVAAIVEGREADEAGFSLAAARGSGLVAPGSTGLLTGSR